MITKSSTQTCPWSTRPSDIMARSQQPIRRAPTPNSKPAALDTAYFRASNATVFNSNWSSWATFPRMSNSDTNWTAQRVAGSDDECASQTLAFGVSRRLFNSAGWIPVTCSVSSLVGKRVARLMKCPASLLRANRRSRCTDNFSNEPRLERQLAGGHRVMVSSSCAVWYQKSSIRSRRCGHLSFNMLGRRA